MKKLLSVATAIIVAVGFAMPLYAAPMFMSKPEQAQANVVEPVKNWKNGHGNHYGWRNNRHWNNRYAWRHGRHWNNRYAWRHGRHWNNRYAWRNCGYYGSCYPRRYGYRNYYPGYYPRSGVSIFLSF